MCIFCRGIIFIHEKSSVAFIYTFPDGNVYYPVDGDHIDEMNLD